MASSAERNFKWAGSSTPLPFSRAKGRLMQVSAPASRRTRSAVWTAFRPLSRYGLGLKTIFIYVPSSSVAWDASTRAARSPSQGSPAWAEIHPRYSMFPSGPRMGE